MNFTPQELRELTTAVRVVVAETLEEMSPQSQAMQKIISDQTKILEQQTQILEEVKHIKETVYGNGKPGLKSIVERNDEFIKSIQAIGGKVLETLAVILFIGLIVLLVQNNLFTP